MCVRLPSRIEHLGSYWTVFRDMRAFCENLSRKSQVSLKSVNSTGALHADLRTFMIISRVILLAMRNVPGKSCRVDHNTRFMFGNTHTNTHPHPNRAVCDSVSQPLRDRGPVNYFFIRRGPGPNKFTSK